MAETVTLTRPENIPYFFINGLKDKDILEDIDNVCSYEVQEVERVLAGMQDKENAAARLEGRQPKPIEWDGKIRLLKRSKNGNYYFPFGLVDRVIRVLRIYGTDFAVNDGRSRCQSIPEVGSCGEIELRPYQRDALTKLVSNCYNASGIISLPTGAGKTIIALFWARMVKGPFWVLVHRKELLDQWHDEIKRLYPGIEVARIGAGYEDKPAFATVAMVQTLANVVKEGKHKFETDLLIMDECHVIPAKNAYSVGMAFQATYRLGLSATPYRTDGEDLKIFACCGEKASVVTVEDLVKGGYITKPKFIMAKIPAADLPHYSSWSNVVRHGITANASRNQAIEDMARKYLKEGRQVYIHVNQIMHGQGLKRRLEDVGAEWVCGSTPKKERTRIIEDYKAGKIPCLVSTLLKEGVSIDGISCLIYAAGGKSEVATIQTIGRALRKDPKFDDAIIIDFMDKGHKYLEEHREQRIATYRTVYGLLFEY